MHERLGPQVLDDLHPCPKVGVRGAVDVHVLGSEPHYAPWAVLRDAIRGRRIDVKSEHRMPYHVSGGTWLDDTVDEVHAQRTDEARHELIDRLFVHLSRRANLLQDSVTKDRDATR